MLCHHYYLLNDAGVEWICNSVLDAGDERDKGSLLVDVEVLEDTASHDPCLALGLTMLATDCEVVVQLLKVG